MPFKALEQLAAKLEGGASLVRAQGLAGSAGAYLVSRLARRLNRPLVVLTPDMPQMRAIAAEIKFFSGNGGNGDNGNGPNGNHDTALPWDAPLVSFPAWDTLIYEDLPPHPETSAARTAALFRAMNPGPFVMVAPVEATFQRLPPKAALEEWAMPVAVGDELDRDNFIATLIRTGYNRVGQVEERGEIAVRGGIIDIFAPHYGEPIRIELFGDEVESIRTFNLSTQRSTQQFEEAVFLPARENCATEAQCEEAIGRLRSRCHKQGFNRTRTFEMVEPHRIDPYTPIRECRLPYFFAEPVNFWDYIPEDAVVILSDGGRISERAEAMGEDIQRGFERAVAAERLAVEPELAYLDTAKWTARLNKNQVVAIESLVYEEGENSGVEAVEFAVSGNEELTSSLRHSRGSDRLLSPLVDRIKEDCSSGYTVNIVCRTPGLAQKFRDLLGEYKISLGETVNFSLPAEGDKTAIQLCLGDLGRGFSFPGEHISLITDSEVFGRKSRRPAPTKGIPRSSLGDLVPRDLIVHVDFGIGRYTGMVRLDVEGIGIESDYLHLEYAGGDRLYLPVTRLNLVQRYSAPNSEHVRLDKLGGKSWEKARKKAAEGIEKMAHELLDLYARRKLASRPPCPAPDLAYREFETTFPYEETRDQAAAIDDVMHDMGTNRPMDRLICGDVGYGKTEVAIRGAFRAVEGGKQVAVMAPTTVLAAQHYHNFVKRFEDYPIEVRMLSRFVGKSAQTEVISAISKGAVDVVIGTHRLLAADIKFKELGLVVIDEEHRFGVAQKEKLKKLRNQVDMLALSATPIPRTLQMGFHGVRDLSVIETPPTDRLAVRTRLARFDDDVVREAIKRELNRSGQIFFVHNRVQSIDAVADHVKRLVPNAKIEVGHGQMREKHLQDVMERFAGGEIEILVCTAIIESGLDIPRANTIIIDRADMFGLADLYQLRGRVGRSNLRAYCWLLAPEERELTEDARKRLQTLQKFSDLGAGFKVAIHDLEIRGAGELLGKNQSGHINALGFDLYTELLDDAVLRLKGEPHGRPPEPEIRLRIPAHFPENYVNDAQLRLRLYDKLTRMADGEELGEAVYELTDRFGPVPDPVKNLLEVMKLRLRLMALRATGLDYNGRDLVVAFDDAPVVDPERIVALVSNEPARFRLTPDHRLRFGVGELESAALLEQASALLSMLE